MRNSCENFEPAAQYSRFERESMNLSSESLDELELSFVYVDSLHERQHYAHRIGAAID